MCAEKTNSKIGKVKKILLIIKNVIVYSLAIIGLVAIIWFIAYRSGKKIGFMQKENESTMQTQTQTTTLGFKDMGKLVTQSAYATVVIDNKDDKKIFDKLHIPFSNRRIIFSYNVKVDAAVDFSLITEKIQDNKIIITLPRAEIYGASIDKDSLKKYLEEGTFKLEETNEALKDIEEQATADSKANGLLEQADTNAKILIENFVKSEESLKDYEVVFEYIGENQEENKVENTVETENK